VELRSDLPCEAHKSTSYRLSYRSNLASSSNLAGWADSSYEVVHPVGLQRRELGRLPASWRFIARQQHDEADQGERGMHDSDKYPGRDYS
jgi:hypothetical protein